MIPPPLGRHCLLYALLSLTSLLLLRGSSAEQETKEEFNNFFENVASRIRDTFFCSALKERPRKMAAGIRPPPSLFAERSICFLF